MRTARAAVGGAAGAVGAGRASRSVAVQGGRAGTGLVGRSLRAARAADRGAAAVVGAGGASWSAASKARRARTGRVGGIPMARSSTAEHGVAGAVGAGWEGDDNCNSGLSGADVTHRIRGLEFDSVIGGWPIDGERDKCRGLQATGIYYRTLGFYYRIVANGVTAVTTLLA